jgi:hypothetical protein
MKKTSHPQYFAQCDTIAFPMGGAEYEAHTAWWLAQCSRLAYDSKINIARNLKFAGFDRVYYFDMRGTQGYLAVHPGDARPFAVLAFRGTEKDYIDILTDIIILRSPLPDTQDKEYTEGNLFAHAGFLQAFQSVWGSALPDSVCQHMTEAEWVGARGVSDIVHDKLADQKIPLFITGHSLGGAIATLAAYHAITHHPDLYLYTFGSPRVANDHLSHRISNTLASRSFRCVHSHDIVPRVPPFFNYTHVKQLVYFDRKRGRVPVQGNMLNDFWVILLLHWDALLFPLSLRQRKPQTTQDHAIAAYINAIEREPMKPR